MDSLTLAASKQPQRSNLASDLKPACCWVAIFQLITPASMWVLPLRALSVASEAMAASKRPRRSHMTSDLNSMTLRTYVPMSLWPLNATIYSIFTERGRSNMTHWLRVFDLLNQRLAKVIISHFCHKVIVTISNKHCSGLARWEEHSLPKLGVRVRILPAQFELHDITLSLGRLVRRRVPN